MSSWYFLIALTNSLYSIFFVQVWKNFFCNTIIKYHLTKNKNKYYILVNRDGIKLFWTLFINEQKLIETEQKLKQMKRNNFLFSYNWKYLFFFFFTTSIKTKIQWIIFIRLVTTVCRLKTSRKNINKKRWEKSAELKMTITNLSFLRYTYCF